MHPAYSVDYDTDSSGNLSYAELLQMIQNVQTKRRMFGGSEEELHAAAGNILCDEI